MAMRPVPDSSLPATLVFILILVLSILALRLVAKHLVPFLWRLASRIYSRHLAARLERPGRGLRRFAERHAPRLTSHLERRLSARRFAGLPLTLLVAGALYGGFLIIELTLELVFEPAELASADEWIEARLEPFRTPILVDAFAWITGFGDNVTVIAIAATATAFGLSGGGVPRNVLPLWVTVIGTQVFTWTGKLALDRQRPEFLTDVVAHSPSFPSGHASSSLAVYGFVAYMLARTVRSPAGRFEVVYWIGVLIALIGFSRMYLHVHYASDVAAGFLVGGFWLLIGIALAELERSRAATDGSNRG